MKHNWPATVLLVAMFLLAQIIGLGVIQAYVDPAKTAQTGAVAWKDLPAVMGYGLERPETTPAVSVAYILVALLIGTILILLIVRWQSVMLWKAWFWLAVVLCLHVALAAFLSSGTALTLSVILASLKVFRPSVLMHNLTELFIYSGLAVIFVPILSTMTTLVLLLLISVYDMYAVWRSKHMATMAQFQAKSGIFAGFLLPYLPQKLVLSRKEAAQAKVRTAILGGGDVGFPLIFAGVVMKELGVQPAVLIPLGATVALLALLWFGQKKRFYPAMPFLTAGCLAGYGVALLL